MINLALTWGKHFILIGLLTFSVGVSTARADDNAAFSDLKLKETMERIEQRGDEFEDRLEAALDSSSLDGSNLEDRLNRWADRLEDEVDNMAENYKERDSGKYTEHLENALIIGTGINRAMLRSEFSMLAEQEWSRFRADLNSLAIAFHRPVMPNVNVITLIPASPELMSKADVKHVMERIEASTDRFKDKFEDAMNAHTTSLTNRADLFTAWARDLEDVSDDMLEEYSENDPKEFDEELQNTMVVASAMNRMVLRSDLTPEASTEWKSLRDDLNILAKTFGHAVLPDEVVTLSQGREPRE